MSYRLPRMFLAAGVLLGVGLGGFVDGIVLHQILQWHHMLTAEGSFPPTSVDGLKDNTLWDGLFHAFTWLATAAGLGLLWNSVPVHRRGWGQVLVGLLAFGWGLFNVVEGVVDHQILGIHHVRDDVSDKLPWDMAFLGIGTTLMAAGYGIARGGIRRANCETDEPSREYGGRSSHAPSR